MYTVINECRACGHDKLDEVLAFGDMPLADGLLRPAQLTSDEPRYPLTLAFCEKCTLVQILETVHPEALYCDDYPYYSSFSEGWMRHCRENALELIETRNLDANSLVVELACNDGYLLRNFVEQGVPSLGIDPAEGPAAAARELGIEVINDFFSRELAETLRDGGRLADVVIGNNVLAHLADLPGFVEGIRAVLKDDGVAVIEVPYLVELVDRCEFDTIYHEHHCYFSVTALCNLFARHGLHLNDVRRLTTHGGSLRVFVGKHPARTESVDALIRLEREKGADCLEYYRAFARRVRSTQNALRQLLGDIKSTGKRVAAYAAAAKGSTLLNSTGIGRDTLDYVVDRNRHKHGKHMPGVHIPIYACGQLLKDLPDYVLLLAWNHEREILDQQASYRKQGGKFIIPIPDPVIV